MAEDSVLDPDILADIRDSLGYNPPPKVQGLNLEVMGILRALQGDQKLNNITPEKPTPMPKMDSYK